MGSCAPPASLAQWSTALLVCACLLGVAALRSAPLRPRRWRVRWLGALDLLGALAAAGLAVWSLALRGRLQALYGLLDARNTADSYYCVFGGGHGPPGLYDAWLRQTAALVDPLQRAAQVTISADVALLCAIGAVALARWLERVYQRRRRVLAQPAAATGAEEGMHEDVLVSALSPTAPQVWRLWARFRRALAVGLVAAVIAVASVGAYAAFRAQQSAAQPVAEPATCSPALTASIVRQIQRSGVSLIQIHDVAQIDAQTAITTARQATNQDALAAATCMFTLLMRTQNPFTLDQDVWLVTYHLEAGIQFPPGLILANGEDWWALVNSQTGALVSASETLEGPAS